MLCNKSADELIAHQVFLYHRKGRCAKNIPIQRKSLKWWFYGTLHPAIFMLKRYLK